MRALSIKQPFAEDILNGHKTIEYRSIPTKIRERVYIYSSSKPADKNVSENAPLGVIVGSIEIIGCECPTNENDDYKWILSNPKRLKRPLKPKNKPQPVFFNPF